MVAVFLLSLLTVLLPDPSSARLARGVDRDSWGMVVISDWPFGLLPRVPCGDADRDALREFYAISGPDPYPLCAAEFVSNNQFDSSLVGVDLIPWCLGDLDRDGLADIAVHSRFGFGGIRVLESPDSFSLPTDSVWNTPDSAGSSLNVAVAPTDVDADSAHELAVDYDHNLIAIYECVGNNSFERKMVIVPGGVPTQTFDMDRDGLPELAVGRSGGAVAFYEPVGDDSLVPKGVVQVAGTPQTSSFYFMAAAPDMDRDGRTELIAPCYGSQWGLRLAVLEAADDDSFAVVWFEDPPGNWPYSVAVGDIQGDSTLEFVFADTRSVRLYRCVGDNQYECFWETDSGQVVATLYDINADGRDELIHDKPICHTIIRAWLPVGVEERVAGALRRVTVAPSVARRSDAIRVEGLPPSSECEIVDASGRMVASLASGVWRPASSAAGTYFLRIHVGNQAVVRKVLVVE